MELDFFYHQSEYERLLKHKHGVISNREITLALCSAYFSQIFSHMSITFQSDFFARLVRRLSGKCESKF